MTAPRRRLLSVDDPLEPRLEPPSVTARARPVGAEVSASRALFVRLAPDEYDAVARAAFELGVHKRELIAALIRHHVNPHTPAGLAALDELLADDGDSQPGGSQADLQGDAGSMAQ